MIVYNYQKKVFEYMGRYNERFDYTFDIYSGDRNTNKTYKIYDKYDSVIKDKNLEWVEAETYRRRLNLMDKAYIDEVMSYLILK